MFTGANDVYSGYRGDRLLKNQDHMGIRRALAGSPFTTVDPGQDPARLAQEDPPRFWDYRWKIAHRFALLRYRLESLNVSRVTQELSFRPRSPLPSHCATSIRSSTPPAATASTCWSMHSRIWR